MFNQQIVKYFKAMKKHTTLFFFTILYILVSISCNNGGKNIRTLSFEEAGDLAYMHTYFQNNRFQLRMTKEEAMEKGIKNSDYDTIVSRIELTNKMIESDLKNNDSVYISLDSSRVDIKSINSKISIKPKHDKD